MLELVVLERPKCYVTATSVVFTNLGHVETGVTADIFTQDLLIIFLVLNVSAASVTEGEHSNGTGSAMVDESNAVKQVTVASSTNPFINLSPIADEWVNAAVFVPKSSLPTMKSYAQVVSSTAGGTSSSHTVDLKMERLCPYAEASGECKYSNNECVYTHGEICDLCGTAALHPRNVEQRKKHVNECIKQHERDMELSFAVARSREKTCGVCFEVIMDKPHREQRFGILPNCNHCFCLVSIRKWRQAKQFDNKIIRACPECRVTSDFVCPSVYWVDTKDGKEKLISDYKDALSTKHCKYFKQGSGKCPFGNKCFYLHALPDGTKTDVGPPQRQRRANQDGEMDMLQQIILWDFLEERENRWYNIDDLEDLVAFFSDSEDSDWSEYDFFFD